MQKLNYVMFFIALAISAGLGQQSLNTTLIGRWENGPTHASFVVGNIAYIGSCSRDLEILDISNPAVPVSLGQAVTPSLVKGIFVSASYAYVADYDYGLRIFDVNNPSGPTEVGFFDTGGSVNSVYVSGSYAYVADGDSGLRIIDVSNPSSPGEVGFFDTGSYASSVYVSGSYAYVADGEDGLYIIRNDLLTGITENHLQLPGTTMLYQNYPNPFNPKTNIEFLIPVDSKVNIKIFNSIGEFIIELVNKEFIAGYHAIEFNATNLASGVYFCKMQTGSFLDTKKLILLK